MSVKLVPTRALSVTLSVTAALTGVVAAGCGDDSVVPGSLCQPLQGTVARVIDGDTLELEPDPDSGDEAFVVRYLLVDAPELNDEGIDDDECFAVEARELNRRLVQGKDIELEYDQDQCFDRFDRLLAYVSVEGRLVNRVLLERGYAFVAHDYVGDNRPASHPDPYLRESELLQIESQAQLLNKGLWGVCE